MEWMAQYWIEAVFGLMLSALGVGYRVVIKRMQVVKAEQGAIRDGICALLRDRIIQAYYHYTEAGCCPIDSQDSVQIMYDQYHALGGNGTVKRLVDELQKLPIEKSYR